MTAGSDGKTDGGRRQNRLGSSRKTALRRWSGLGFGLAAGLALFAAVAAVSNLSLQSGTARDEIKARLGALAGLPVTVEGASEFTLLPRTALTLTKIRIGSPAADPDADADAEAVLGIEAIRADLDLWQALLGRTRVKRLTVIRPKLLSAARFIEDASEPGDPIRGLGRAPEGRGGWSSGSAATPGGHEALAAFFKVFLSRFGDLGTVEVLGGVFRMGRETGVGISDADIVVSWPSPGSAAEMAGSYVWNGEPAEIDLRLEAPIEFLSGRTSAIDVTLSSPPLSASFAGRGAIGEGGEVAGKVRVAVPSLGRSVRWLGDPRAFPPDFGALSLEADLLAAGRTVNLRNASVSLDGSPGQGAVEMLLQAGGRPAIGGTLAFDQLDLARLAEAVAPFPGTALALRKPIGIDFVRDLDLDLRMSASRAAIGALPIADLAATVKIKDGVATLDVGDASLLGGRGQGRLSLDARGHRPAAKGSATLSAIDTPALLAALGVSSFGLSGRSNIDAAIEAPATTWADILSRTRMALQISAGEGAFSGFDPAMFSADGTGPLAAAVSGTAMPFQALEARLKTAGPRVDVEALSIKGPAGDILAAGALSAATGRIDLSGTFSPSAAAAPPEDGLGAAKAMAFTLRGAWPRPAVAAPTPAKPI